MDSQMAQAISELSESLRYVGAGAALGALGGVGIGIAIIFHAFITSVARQPAVEKKLMPITWLAFALTEAMALFALLMVFLFIFT